VEIFTTRRERETARGGRACEREGRNSLLGSGASSAVGSISSVLLDTNTVSERRSSGDRVGNWAPSSRAPRQRGRRRCRRCFFFVRTHTRSTNPPLSKGTLLLTHTRTQTGNRAAVCGDISLIPKSPNRESEEERQSESAALALLLAPLTF